MKHGNTLRTSLALAGALLACVAGTAALAPAPARASTAIGNGGDVIERFLEATRYTLGQANAKIAAGVDSGTVCRCGDAQAKDALCTTLRALTQDQADYCRMVLTQTAAALAQLNAGTATVPLTVSAGPLYVVDPFGHKMEVAAETDLGPAGPIVFSEDSIRTVSPMDLLALMGHEFHHKTAFPTAGHYIDDNSPIGPFTQPGGGRTLLDALGAALSWYAYEHRLVGREFQIDDRYSCEVQETTTGIDFSSLGSSVRIFPVAGNLDAYETGVGNWPSDLQCALKEDATSRLFFKVKIHEDAGCGTEAGSTRMTELEIWRLTAAAVGQEATATQLESRTIAGENPVCDEPGVTPAPLSLEHAEGSRHYVFTVQYQGSTGRLVPNATGNQN